MKKGGAYINKNKQGFLRRLQTDLRQLQIQNLENDEFKLLEKKQTNPPNNESSIYFSAVFSMIANADDIVYIRRSEKEDLADVSGFFFHIKSTKTYFERMNENGMEEDVYNLLLKIELLVDDSDYRKYYTFKSEKRRYAKRDQIYNEALIQQQIYNISSVTTYQMAPSVFDVSIFDSDDTCDVLFTLLQDNINDDDEYGKRVIRFLSNQKRNNTVKGVSMISMESAQNFQPFYHFFWDGDYDTLTQSEEGKDKIYEIFAYIYSLVLSIYIITGIFSKGFSVDDCMIKKEILGKPLKNNIQIFDFDTFVAQDDLSMTNINERYLEFFESTTRGDYLPQRKYNSPIQYDLVIKFFDEYYPFLNNMKLPRRMDGIFALNDMHNPLFQEYFDTFIKDMLRRIDPETIEKLKIKSNKKLIIESYSTDVDIVVLTEEQEQQLIAEREAERERQRLESHLIEQQVTPMHVRNIAPPAGGRRRTMKTRRRKLSKKKKSKTKRKRN